MTGRDLPGQDLYEFSIRGPLLDCLSFEAMFKHVVVLPIRKFHRKLNTRLTTFKVNICLTKL